MCRTIATNPTIVTGNDLSAINVEESIVVLELGQSRYTLALFMVTRLPLVAVIKRKELLFSNVRK